MATERKIRNTKALFHFLTEQMERLNNDEISINEASTYAKLAREAVNILKYELVRAQLQMQIDQHCQNQNFKRIELREVESTTFEKTN